MNAALDYADSSPLAAKPVIICPGGMWPVKHGVQQAVRPAWMDQQAAADQEARGLAARPPAGGGNPGAGGAGQLAVRLLEPFKGKEFAMPDPARWT